MAADTFSLCSAVLAMPRCRLDAAMRVASLHFIPRRTPTSSPVSHRGSSMDASSFDPVTVFLAAVRPRLAPSGSLVLPARTPSSSPVSHRGSSMDASSFDPVTVFLAGDFPFIRDDMISRCSSEIPETPSPPLVLFVNVPVPKSCRPSVAIRLHSNSRAWSRYSVSYTTSMAGFRPSRIILRIVFSLCWPWTGSGLFFASRKCANFLFPFPIPT